MPRRPKRTTRPPLTRRATPGASPGLLTANPNAAATRMTVTRYDAQTWTRQEVESVEEAAALVTPDPPWEWIQVQGLASLDALQRLGEQLGIHRLALEDVVNIPQRPKAELYGDQWLIILQVPIAVPGRTLTTEQVSIFVLPGAVLTFQERPGPLFDPIHARLEGGRTRLRAGGPGYLAYALIDTIIDHAFPTLEAVAERLELLEEAAFDARPEALDELHAARRDLMTLRRAVWPQRDLLATLQRDDEANFSEETRLFLRDCHDHATEAMETLEMLRELTAGLMNIHMTAVSNRMNEVMKVLTIISTIFIPLSFIAGLYGMNFDREASAWNMPELGWAWGYPGVLGLMATISLGLLLHFRRRGWL